MTAPSIKRSGASSARMRKSTRVVGWPSGGGCRKRQRTVNAESLEQRVAHLKRELFECVCAFNAQIERVVMNGRRGEEPAAASVRTTFFAQRVAGDGPMIAMREIPTRRSGPLSGSMWLSSLNETTACRSPACHCHRPC